MNKSTKATRYGNSDLEKLVSQEPTNLNKNKKSLLRNKKKKFCKISHLCELDYLDPVWVPERMLRERLYIAHNKLANLYPNDEDEDTTPEHFDPQNGSETSMMNRVKSAFAELAKYANVPDVDALVREVEGIVFLYINLCSASDFKGVLSAFGLFMGRFTQKSLIGQVTEYLEDVFCETQNGEEPNPDLSKEEKDAITKGILGSGDWIQMMKDVRNNWAVVKDNKLFTHFSKLLGLAVTLGMCEATSVTFEVKQYKVWEPCMKVVHGSAMDVADAALNTITFFVETFSLCMEQQSLKPLLWNDQAAAELDEEYANIILWWDLVKNGNLERVANISTHEFDRRLEALCSTLRNLMGTKNSFEKKLIQDKFMKVLKVKNDYITHRLSCGLRKAPFALEFVGNSNQGKSSVSEQMITALLTSGGLPTGKEYQASYNGSDKYFSTWSTDKLVLLIDDMANEKSQFVERPPTRVIIDVCNNAPFYANMADIDSKGKVFVEPNLVVVTTNVKDLDARIYSNCPYSIQRRMHMVISVNAKAMFQKVDSDGKPQGLDSQKVRRYYEEKGIDPTFDDLWDLTVEQAVQPKTLTEAAGYAPMTFRGKLMKDVSFSEVLQMSIEMYQEHLKDQEDMIERMEKRVMKKIELCGHLTELPNGKTEKCCQIKGYCDLHDKPEDKQLVCKPVESFDKQFGEEIADSLKSGYGMITNRISSDLFGLDTAIESAVTYAIMSSARKFARHWDWMSIVPTPWLKMNWFKNGMMLLHKDKLKRAYIRKTCLMWGGVIGITGLSSFWTRKSIGHKPLTLMLGVGLTSVATTVQASMVQVVKDDFHRELVDRNTIESSMKDIRDRHVGRICSAFAIVGALYGMSRVYRAFTKFKAEPQGTLEPKTRTDVEKRDSEQDVWVTAEKRGLPIENKTMATTTSDQLAGLIEKNQVYGTIHGSDKNYMVNGVFLKTGLIAVPDHYFVSDTLNITFRKKNPESAGGKFVAKLSKSTSFTKNASDVRYCYCSTGGSFKDLTPYLTDASIGEVEFLLRWRSKEGDIVKANGLAMPKKCDNDHVIFEGLKYRSLTMNTFSGLCGAVIAAVRKPVILGLHVGGVDDTQTGCCSFITKSDVKEAESFIRSCEGTLLTGTAEKFETQVLGVNVLKNTPMSPKSPLRFLPKDSQIEYFGSCPGESTFKTSVRPTVISEHVTEVLGEPNIYGPPIVNPQWEGWQTCLANLAVPAHPYDPDLLTMAVRDYKADLIDLFQSDLWNNTRPLTDQENINGIAGMKFVDAIKISTSVGFPLKGPKSNFINENEPTDDFPCNREFTQDIMDEIRRCEECYARGERAYTIAKACKKDEVLAKRKCRIFYGNPIPLTFLIRKYYLMIVRVLQMNPLVSECAVGVNSHGPEWDQLHNHIIKHGEDRLFGGDYGKYDQKLPSQLILAALRILIDCARVCGYSERDLRIMEAMAGDIVYSIIAYNGDLIGLTEGTHISGNSLTVIINGICGSLNLRSYFYKEYPTAQFETRMKFRDFVSLVTYGDDNIGSVSNKIERFTIKGASGFLAKYGQVYTMPDKESELLDFLPFDQFEFLKRKSVYHPKIGLHLGALVEKSCVKMLHCHLWNKTSEITQEHAAAMNVDTALREWFNHGEDVYEQRRVELREIASRGGILHLCTELETSYDQRVEKWFGNYGDQFKTNFD